MSRNGATSAPTARTGAAPSGLFRAVQVGAGLTLLVLASQFVTAGQLFQEGGPEELHAAGAIVLHVVSGLTAIAAVLAWRRGAVPVWVAALSVVVFVLGFVQAATGGRETLAVHIPVALVLTVSAVWLAAWVLTPRAARR